MTALVGDSADLAALDPFFRIIQEGLAGLVDGEHFLDLLAQDVVIEYVVSVPGYPRRIQGRRAVADLYRGYGDLMVLHSADELAVHHDPATSVVVLEYAVHGRAVRTGRAYDNHFVSVISIKDRQVTHWRDYLDPVAVFHALGWPAEPRRCPDRQGSPGHDLHGVAVRVGEVRTAAAEEVVGPACVGETGVGVVRDPDRVQPGDHGVELIVGHEERVVL